jgi:phage shock protein C
MIAGVAGGLAEYFNLDPTAVRLVYAIVTVLTGFFPGTVLYVALALIVPTGSAAGGPETIGTQDRAAVAGAILVAVGVLILVGNLGLFSFWSWGRLWPLILILMGGALLLRRRT